MSIDETRKIVEHFESIDWSKRSSIILGTSGNLVLSMLVAAGVPALGYTIPLKAWVVWFAISQPAMFILWVRNRWIAPYDRRTISVGFAIKADQQSANLHKKIGGAFNRHIAEKGLGDYVKLRKLPSDLYFESAKDAEKYLVAKGLRVLIWGEASCGTFDGNQLSVFNLKTTYQHARLDVHEQVKLRNLIGLGAQRGAWAVEHSNSLVGTAVVSQNILEISMLALGICMITAERVEDVERGVRIIENLLRDLEGREEDLNFPNLAAVREKTTLQFIAACQWLVGHYLFSDKDTGKAFDLAKRGLEVRPHAYALNIQMALACWRLDRHSDARRFTNLAASIGSDLAMHKLNLAFFNFYDGKYGYGLKRYKQLPVGVVANNNIITSIEFLEVEFEKTMKPALLFAAGWLNCRYADSVRGKQLLGQFIDIVRDDTSYKPLIREAQRVAG